MFLARPSESRGKADFDWLRTRYTFSFAAYYDPHYMGFRSLRVLNQDCVAPQKGFPMHAHTDMEILTLVLQGTVEHRDSLGHTRKIRAGQAQRMSAGSGVQHSESNPSPHEELQLLQIWIEPAELGLRPSYEEAEISSAKNRLNLVAGPKAAEAPLTLNQDAWLYHAELEAGISLPLASFQTEHQWVQVIAGELVLNQHILRPGDGLAISRESELVARSQEGARFLLFDLA